MVQTRGEKAIEKADRARMIGLAYGDSGMGSVTAGHAFGTNPGGAAAPPRDDHYDAMRDALLTHEKTRRFDAAALEDMTPLEIKAHGIAELVKKFDDNEGIYNPKKRQRTYKSAPFLTNLQSINKNAGMLPIAQHMPKGAHLHIHFNACLKADFFLKFAVSFSAMHIRLNIHLLTPANYDNCEIQFEIMKTPGFDAGKFPSNLVEDENWHPNSPFYESTVKEGIFLGWMPYQKFLQSFPGVKDQDFKAGKDGALEWLISKVILKEQQVYQHPQNIPGIWDLFNRGTRLLKGLFNYESALRAYVRELIADFVQDKITYAEIRAVFPGNVTMFDDASGSYTSEQVCLIIEEEVALAIADPAIVPRDSFFQGLKLIYCIPKIKPFATYISQAMDECIALKLAHPNLICGLDLVGWEDGMLPIHFFKTELLNFREQCLANDPPLDIPFVLHAGETLSNGDKADHNLLDAIMLNAKRIGHGFSLLNHPYLMLIIKERNICLEVCPIGNEILRLCPDGIKGHNMVGLLANGVHCTLCCDNATFYSSTLSHDFYQFFISSEYMSIISWKVVAGWSIRHSLMNSLEKSLVQKQFDKDWIDFCEWIIKAHPSEEEQWVKANESK